jgi:hypothetical protein
MFTKLHIEYADPADLHNTIVVQYHIRPTDIAQRWVNKVLLAKQQYPIDDPTRFYGFGSYESQVNDALDRINYNITVINLHRQIINRNLSDINDQDTLNYLHNIFEIHHGLLNQQIDDEKMGKASFLMILTGGQFAYQRKDGVWVVPIGCLRD